MILKGGKMRVKSNFRSPNRFHLAKRKRPGFKNRPHRKNQSEPISDLERRVHRVAIKISLLYCKLQSLQGNLSHRNLGRENKLIKNLKDWISTCANLNALDFALANLEGKETLKMKELETFIKKGEKLQREVENYEPLKPSS